MIEIEVKSSSHSYNITIGEELRFHLSNYISIKEYSSIMVITDDNVADLYLKDILNNFSDSKHIFHSIVPNGEQSKSVQQYYQLLTEAMENGLDRKSLILAFGGGVIGDLAGFVAATYMRGIDYIQIPTTILAHDSSVGGKVAINHELGKNLIGSFYPPKAVIYDVNTLETLSEEEVRSGYAELVKEALISDETFLNLVLNTELSSLSNSQLKKHLELAIRVKASIVESDEREAGIRMHLNLGHTLGHALESELGYGTLTHGEAIAIGILFAIRVSEKTFGNRLPYNDLLNWLIVNNYPVKLKSLNTNRLIDKMKLDKKVVDEKIKMVLLKDIGEPAVVELNDEDLRGHLNSFIGELVEK